MRAPAGKDRIPKITYILSYSSAILSYSSALKFGSPPENFGDYKSESQFVHDRYGSEKFS